jgi:C1A family cysteine protease
MTSRTPHPTFGNRRVSAIIFLLALNCLTAPLIAALPTNFDWRDHTTLPPVRNQQQCGSCWAVCATDIFEIAIYRLLGQTVDLSEQWLVSCTQGGDGCNGGYIGYALDSCKCSGSTQTDPCGHAGGVLEADFPYTATNAPCNCPYDHPYCITSWSLVAGSRPSSEQIKQAIYDYGPVACHMEVYNDLYSYSSGIYTHITGASMGLKAMVLVGWGNSAGQNYWIVRNTWGPTWGESGYLKVAFDTCNIGDYSAYVSSVSGIEPKHFCGESGQVYLTTDINKDCYVDLKDLAVLAADWLKCTDLSDKTCSWD